MALRRTVALLLLLTLACGRDPVGPTLCAWHKKTVTLYNAAGDSVTTAIVFSWECR